MASALALLLYLAVRCSAGAIAPCFTHYATSHARREPARLALRRRGHWERSVDMAPANTASAQCAQQHNGAATKPQVLAALMLHQDSPQRWAAKGEGHLGRSQSSLHA